MTRLGKAWQAVHVLWALPCSVCGLLLGLLVWLAGGQVRRVAHTLEVAWSDAALQPRWLALWLQRWPFGAITLGHVIIGQSDAQLTAVRTHEWVHVRQYERWGLIFFVLYPLASVWAVCQGRRFYKGNHFEQQAYDPFMQSTEVQRLERLHIQLPMKKQSDD